MTVASVAPILTTERLTLRAPVMADFPAFAAFWATERSAGMGGPSDLRGTWGWFCHDVALWSLVGHGGFMLERREDGVVVGEVSVSHGPLFPEVELAWCLFEGFEGQGYVSEAAPVVRDWAFQVRGIATLVSYVGLDNPASARVAERLGAVIDPDAPTMDGKPCLVYRHRAPEGRT